MLRFSGTTYHWLPLMLINNRYQLSISNQFNASLKCNRSATISICYEQTPCYWFGTVDDSRADTECRIAKWLRICEFYFYSTRKWFNSKNRKAAHFVTLMRMTRMRKNIITHHYIQILVMSSNQMDMGSAWSSRGVFEANIWFRRNYNSNSYPHRFNGVSVAHY